MKFFIFFFSLLAGGIFSRLPAQTPDVSRPIDRCNISWDHPSANAGESMPCGGGDIGLNVWVEKGDLLLYLSRSGTFDENNAFLKLGRIRIRLNPNPLEGGEFRQELVLRNGSVVVSGSRDGMSVQIRVWVDVHRPVIHIEMNSSRPVEARALYESWRVSDRSLSGRANNADSYKWAARQAPGGQVITYRDSIRFADPIAPDRLSGRRRDSGILFYHRNRPGPDVFDVTVRQQGLESVKSHLRDPLRDLTFGGMLVGEGMRPAGLVKGRYLDTDFSGWQLVSDHRSRSRHIDCYLATAQTSTAGEWEDSLRQSMRKARAHEKTAWAETRSWWETFWNRSFIYIRPEETMAAGGTVRAATSTGGGHSPEWQAGRNYQLFRYMLGCNAYGEYPTKFNGGLFTYDPSLTDTSARYTPDFRNWGGGTMTAQNQRLVYFPMIRSGDFEMIRPEFRFYLRSLTAAELRTEVYWGHKGAAFTEQIENFGLPNTAEYGWDMPADHDKGVEYNAWLEYEWDTVLEFCLMMLETERYTGQDIHEYIPFIESCLRFFNEHYQYLSRWRGRRVLDAEGHLVLYPGSAGETYKMAYNSSSTIAGLHTILTRLLELPGGYLDDSARKEWKTMLGRLPPLSFRSFDGHPTIAPARSWERVNNTESMQLYPVFPWGIYGIGKPGLDTALNTWKYDTDAIKFRSFFGWKQDNIFAARLGLTEDAAALTVRKLKDSERRFPAFWGPGFDWTPDHNWGGSGMIGLQEMLMQTDGRTIRLFPAWPEDWDVHFKLYAPYNTTVEATLRHGRVEMLKVEPEERKKDIISAF
jgi:hypothetical protein